MKGEGGKARRREKIGKGWGGKSERLVMRPMGEDEGVKESEGRAKERIERSFFFLLSFFFFDCVCLFLFFVGGGVCFGTIPRTRDWDGTET